MQTTGQMAKVNTDERQVSGPGRMAGPDILRCVAMMMVVVLHFLGKGNLLGDVTESDMGAVGTAAWVLESFCIVAVNVYMFISGYFLCNASFKLSRLIGLYLQIWFYSVGAGVLAVVLGVLPAGEADTHYFLSMLFPVSMGHYWFMTAYVFLYLLLPFLQAAVEKMTKQQLGTSVLLLLTIFCGLKSVLPFRLEEDGLGYDCLWYVCVFLAAAYIRKYGIKFLERRANCICLYVGGCAALFLEMLLLRLVYLRTGKLGLILKVSFEYNHVFAFLAAVGLAGCFMNWGGRRGARADGQTGMQADARADGQTGMQAEGRTSGRGEAGGAGRPIASAAGKAAPYVLGVYLLHENLGFRYGWQNLFGAERINGIPGLLAGTAAAAVCVFVTGVIIDWLRTKLMKGVHSLLLHLDCCQRVFAGVERVDESFRNRQN